MSALFSSHKLGGLTLSNRIVVSPMCQYSAGEEGVTRPWHLMHYGNCAISGAGLVIVEATAVEAIGRITLNCLGLYDDRQEMALARLVADTKTFSDAAFGIQLSHAGRKASIRASWQGRGALPDEEGGWQIEAPSAVAMAEGWRVPTELDAQGMKRIIHAFANAAKRADRCGFDLVELHGAHGYLLHSFVSALSNRRTDRYGGSLENRLRFPLEVAAAVREAWPREKAFGIRINSTDWHPDGFKLDEAVIYARRLKEAGLDYVTTSAGGAGLHGIAIPPIVPGYMVEYAKRVRDEVGLCVMAVGMILLPEQAEDIVATAKADFVALGRGLLDDPRWGWHASNRLSPDRRLYPRQYTWAQPDRWPGYSIVHGSSEKDTFGPS